MFNIYGEWIPDGAIYHHGILGMRWGKRNGPPYPLSPGDHSASEKKAGWRKSLDSTADKQKHSVSLHQQEYSSLTKAISKVHPTFKKRMKNWKEYAIKNKDGSVVGNITMNRKSQDELNLVWMNVDKKHRGNKYAQDAMRQIIDGAKKDNAKYITLDVPRNSPDARHIYEKLGFVSSDKKPTRMRLSLSAKRQ